MPIEIKNLSYVYNPETVFEKRALDNINLDITDGEFVGLIGHTGSGKSTLIQHMNALLTPTSGRILINGQDIHADKSKLKSIRQRVGLVFQYPEHQLFEMTIYEDVAFGPRNMGLDEKEIDRRIKQALSIVGIEESQFELSPFDLSGGQKRRVAIAGVLAMEPEILILDEPTAGLDPRGRDEILNKINEMHKRLNITVILVSHSMEDIARLVGRVVVMESGKILLQGSPDQVFTKVRELERVGLTAPQISRLMLRLNENGFNIPSNIFTAEDAVRVLYELLPVSGPNGPKVASQND